VALVTQYHELWQTVRALREIVDEGEHLRGDSERELVA